MYATEFDRLLKGKSITDFERQILKDYQITDAEYAQAREALKECATDAGFDLALIAGGGIDVGPGPELAKSIPNTDDQATATNDMIARCEQGTTVNIGYLYEMMHDNPDGLTGAQELRACFERFGARDGDGLSDDELNQMWSSDKSGLSPDAVACLDEPRRT